MFRSPSVAFFAFAGPPQLLLPARRSGRPQRTRFLAQQDIGSHRQTTVRLVAPPGAVATAAASPGHTQAFVGEYVRGGLENAPTMAAEATQRMKAAGQRVREELRRLQQLQPPETPSVSKRPLYPDGLRMILLVYAAMVLTVQFFQLAIDVAYFGWAVAVSGTQQFLPHWLRIRLAPESQALPSPLKDMASGVEMPRNARDSESVEWVNAAMKKMWRLYEDELTEITLENLTLSIKQSMEDDAPPFLRNLTVESLEMGGRAPWIRNVEKLPTRSDQDLVYLGDVRYDGDARFMLLAQLGVGKSASLRVNVPVEVSSMDIDARVWVRARLVPKEPYLGELSMAFVRKPRFSLVVKPFKVVDVMELPGLSRYLRTLLTEEIPSQYVLPTKIDILELVPKEELKRKDSEMKNRNADGILAITIYEARNLKGTTTLGLSNPSCVISVSNQVVRSKADKFTSDLGRRGNPLWNQQFEMLVENPIKDRLRLDVVDRYGIKTRSIGFFEREVSTLVGGKREDSWISLRGTVGLEAKIKVGLYYRSFVDEAEMDSYTSEVGKKQSDDASNDQQAVKIPSSVASTGSAGTTPNGAGVPLETADKRLSRASDRPESHKTDSSVDVNGSSVPLPTVDTHAPPTVASPASPNEPASDKKWFELWRHAVGLRERLTKQEAKNVIHEMPHGHNDKVWYEFWKLRERSKDAGFESTKATGQSETSMRQSDKKKGFEMWKFGRSSRNAADENPKTELSAGLARDERTEKNVKDGPSPDAPKLDRDSDL